jgi:hypothetical protein
MSKLEIDTTLHRTATPPRVRLMPASHSLTSGPHPHHLGLPARPFHGTHEDLQRARSASDDPPALPFNWIQPRLARVNLDRHTSSAARAPAASEIYLARRSSRDTHLVQFRASDAPHHGFHLKNLVFTL